MTNENKISLLKDELKAELINNILPYWMDKMEDDENGGFYGRISGEEQLMPHAEKGGILNARILWTFSSAYIALRDPAYLKIATRARDYILAHFFDTENGGTYWSLTYDGKLLDPKKQIYSIAFFIYAFSEYYRATGDKVSLDKAVELFHLIENYSFDLDDNGYFEAYSRDWKLLDNLRLSEKDANEKKTMNTHLHILEAYTNLYRVWNNSFLKDQLQNLLLVFLDKIVDNETCHLNLFFDEKWKCKSSVISYGHDIEASWLLYEAAEVLGDESLKIRTAEVCMKIVNAASEGLQDDGSIIYEKDKINGHVDRDRHWWPQAEAIVGYLNAYQLTQEDSFFGMAGGSWDYIKKHLIDHKNGEWFWSIKADGSINRTDDKAGFWKCPYHNARACLETVQRCNSLGLRK
ncbi:MAG: AGE family epimerase/isomerase [Bacteroidota bacterium]|nr:AGE family epimerase/isomerase [Bacteroidota bacterium]